MTVHVERSLQSRCSICWRNSHASIRCKLLKLLIVVAIVASTADAFQQTNSVGWGRNAASFSQQQSDRLMQQQQYSRIRTSLHVGKSGARLVETEEDFEKFVVGEGLTRPVLVFFSAPWCGPCRLTNPVVKEIMKQFSEEIDVVEVCTDDLAEIASDCGVVSIPTIQFYYSKQLVDTIVGCVAKSVLANAVDKVLEDIKILDKPPPQSPPSPASS